MNEFGEFYKFLLEKKILENGKKFFNKKSGYFPSCTLVDICHFQHHKKKK